MRLILQYPAPVNVCAPSLWLNTLRPRQNGRHFPDDIFKWIFLNENLWIPIKISLTFVPQGPITNIPALVQIMACRRPGDKPLFGPMMVRLPMHICVTRPQWVKYEFRKVFSFSKANLHACQHVYFHFLCSQHTDMCWLRQRWVWVCKKERHKSL